MMKPTDSAGQDAELDAIRRDIDMIDDGLMSLLARRFEATARVRQAKAKGNGAASPFRPAREAQILRKLLAQGQGSVPPDVTVRLWRAILNGSSIAQAPVAIHVSKRLSGSMAARLRIRDHFGAMPVEEYRDEAQALMQIDQAPSDIAIVETQSPWLDPFLEGRAGGARIFSCLPFLADEPEPKLLVFGLAPAEPTGDDQTLIVSDGRLPRDFHPQPVWEMKVGNRRLTALPGFLSEHESPLVGVMRGNAQLGLKIAGHYPSPIQASP
jgi:chorismate mutase / prephenate dehydratase